MTNQEQYDAICENSNKVPQLEEEIKDLVFRLDRTTKQRNALMIALNYVNNTIISMEECSKYNPKYSERYYKNHIGLMREVMKNALLMAVDKSEGSIKMEVEYDNN